MKKNHLTNQKQGIIAMRSLARALGSISEANFPPRRHCQVATEGRNDE